MMNGGQLGARLDTAGAESGWTNRYFSFVVHVMCLPLEAPIAAGLVAVGTASIGAGFDDGTTCRATQGPHSLGIG